MAQRTLSRRSRRDEDEYDEEPRSRRRRDEDDEYEEDRPARSRRRAREEEDEDEEPPARGRRRSRRAEEEDEEEPRGRGRRRARDEEEDEDEDHRPSRRSRRSRDDDEDGASSRRPRGRSRDEARGPRTTRSTVGRGWDGYNSVKDYGGDYVKTWPIPKKPTLIKFLDEEPFSTYAQHWLDEITKGKKSFICLGDDCPLCDELGDKPRGYALFNILDLTDPDHPKVEVWQTGKRIAGLLKEYSEDKKTSPLNREDLYWSVFKTGDKGGNVQVNLNPVKARDLLEDWDCEPFTEDELEEFYDRLHTEDEVITISSRKELRAVAASYDS